MTDLPKQTDNTDDQPILERYLRAQAIERENYSNSTVLNAQVHPHWIDNNRFWYARVNNSNREYRLVDAKAATNIAAFDHKELAIALSSATEKPVSEVALPIDNLLLVESSWSFYAFGESWLFDDDSGLIQGESSLPTHWLVSPDGRKAVFLQNHNLWLRDLENGRERPLTADGILHNCYAVQPEARNLFGGLDDQPDAVCLPEAMWSPDSKHLFTVQLDERNVRTLTSVLYAPQDGLVHPRAVERKYALPGDKNIAQYRFLLIDVETGLEVEPDYKPVEDSFIWHGVFSGNRAWWSGDGRKAYFLDMARGQKSVRVVELVVDSGRTRVLFDEHADTYLEIGHSFDAPTAILPIPATDELIWFSQRTGFAHLYLYDLNTGECKNNITSGDWHVRNVIYFDAGSREVFVQVIGRVENRDPYYREIARVHVDSGEVTLIASSNHDYDMCNDYGGMGGLSPSGEYVVSNSSRVDSAPVAELRDRHGEVILRLESADLSALPKDWQWPEPIQTVAADGTTPIYGVVFRPTDFDPNKKYPVLDFCNTSPFYAVVPKRAFTGYFETAAAFAELGMIVVMMDGRGTSFRDRGFRDYGYGNFLENGGITDRVAGIKQLAKHSPYMDLNRVGIMDFDGSNAGVVGLLAFPEFYRVGVASSIYDPRLVKQGEVYMGLTTQEKRNQAVIWGDAVNNLKGRLLLITGLRDMYFHPAATFQLTDALIRANKDFDHLVQPNGGHGWRLVNGRRRIWDFLVKHLMDINPPTDFKLKTGLEVHHPGQMTEK
jgi:dipeptidyl-peptidase 4